MEKIMREIMRELYYMIDEWAGQQYEMDEGTKSLEERKLALQDEIARRIGEDGQNMVETLANLSLELDTIHNKALFRAAVRLGTELAGPRKGTAAVLLHSARP